MPAESIRSNLDHENENVHNDRRRMRHLSATDFARMREQGKSGWAERDRAVKERDSAIKSVKKYGEKRGYNIVPHIKDLEDANSPWEVFEKVNRMKEGATNWYRKLLINSGAYEPINGDEKPYLERELREVVEGTGKKDGFKDLELSEGEFNMVSTLERFDEDIKPRIDFRNRLKRLNPLVRAEYFRMQNTLKYKGRKEVLLDDIEGRLKPVLNGPQVLQYEFEQKKTAPGSKDTAKIVEELTKNFEGKKKKYFDPLSKNAAYFGANTCQEFKDWFEELPTFAHMEQAIKELPDKIKERKDLYERKDAILKDVSPEIKAKFNGLIKGMRRHELEDFMPDLESAIKKDSPHVGEYVATMITAKKDEVPLYTALEIAMMKTSIKKDSLDVQRAKLLILKSDIEDRAQVVEDYFKLDKHLRNDDAFLSAHSIDRKQILDEANDRKANEQTTPFDASNLDSIDSEDIDYIEDLIDSGEANNTLNFIENELEAEGETEAIDLQKEVREKVFGIDQEAKAKNGTQIDAKRERLQFWVRDANRGKVSEEQARSQGANQHAKWEFMQLWENAQEEGYTMHSGGEVVKDAHINLRDLSLGHTETVHREMHREGVKYAEDLTIFDKDGKMVRGTVDKIDRLSKPEFNRLASLVAMRLVREHMGASTANASVITNSDKIQNVIKSRMFKKEYGHLNNHAG